MSPIPLQSWVTGRGPQSQYHLSDASPDVIVRDSSGHAFHLHKCMLIQHSNVFKLRLDPQRPAGAAWDSSPDPSTGLPILTLPNELPDFTHAELSRLFHLMYMGSYSTGGNPKNSTMETQLVAHSRCYALGDRLDAPGLKALAVRNFRAIAAKNEPSEDDGKGYDYSPDLAMWARVIDSVFSLTTVSDLDMRSAVVDALAKYDAETLVANDDIQDMLERFHDLAVHMYRLMVDVCADKGNNEMRLRKLFRAKGAYTVEAEDEMIYDADPSKGW